MGQKISLKENTIKLQYVNLTNSADLNCKELFFSFNFHNKICVIFSKISQYKIYNIGKARLDQMITLSQPEWSLLLIQGSSCSRNKSQGSTGTFIFQKQESYLLSTQETSCSGNKTHLRYIGNFMFMQETSCSESKTHICFQYSKLSGQEARLSKLLIQETFCSKSKQDLCL